MDQTITVAIFKELMPDLSGYFIWNYLLLYLLIIIFLFFLIREITLWYFRINENTKSLSRIADALDKIAMTDNFATQEVDKSSRVLDMNEKDKEIGDNQESDIKFRKNIIK